MSFSAKSTREEDLDIKMWHKVTKKNKKKQFLLDHKTSPENHPTGNSHGFSRLPMGSSPAAHLQKTLT
jgi:hypothetical protein